MRQSQAMSVLLGGDNVFLTGAPGSGKTYVIKEFIRRARSTGREVAVTATTGIAASHINGTTLHSWSGLGVLDFLSKDMLKKISGTRYIVNRYSKTDVLIIDEISMLHGSRLEMVNMLAKEIRGNDEAFGGMQVVLVGDLFQLPPVNRNGGAADFVNQSAAWQELTLQICYLTEQHRQTAYDGLLSLLEAMRAGDIQDDQASLLVDRLQARPPEGAVITRLYSHNVDVDQVNAQHLKALSGESEFYKMVTKGKKAKREQLMKSLLVPEYLELKVGAEVMFVANNFAEGYVNGSRGRIVDFVDDEPVVQLRGGRLLGVQPYTWMLNEDGKTKAEAIQLPIRLAWAITIHKSQGMSLDAATIDLSRTFSPGMGYVALSRVRSIDGLFLEGVNEMSLSMHPHMGEFDRQLRDSSATLADKTSDFSAADIPDAVSDVVDEALFEILKRWRFEKSQAAGVPPYIIAHNTVLSAVAARRPVTIRQLEGISGLGPRKIELFGNDIVDIVQNYLHVAAQAEETEK